MNPTKKILIIGINSFLAKNLYKLFSEEGEEVWGVYHKNIDEDIKHIKLVSVDEITNLEPELFKYVFIISAFVPYTNSSDTTSKLVEANVLLVDKIVRHFKHNKIIYCSSVSLYENVKDEIITEDTVVKMQSPYAISKYWGEQIIMSQAPNYSIVRMSSIYGIGMNQSTFIPKIIDNALQQKNITLFGDGSRKQNYIYVKDAANILKASALTSDNTIYLGVSEKSVSNIEVAQIVNKFIPCEIKFLGEDNSASYSYDNRKTNLILPSDFKFTALEIGLQKVIEWRKKMC